MKHKNIYLLLLVSIMGLTACPFGGSDDEEPSEGIVGTFIMDSFILSSRRFYTNSEGEKVVLLQSEDQLISSEFIIEFFEDGTYQGGGPAEVKSDVITENRNYITSYFHHESAIVGGEWRIDGDQLKTSEDKWVFFKMTSDHTRPSNTSFLCFKILSMSEDEVFLEIDTVIDWDPTGLNEDTVTRKGNILLTRIM